MKSSNFFAQSSFFGGITNSQKNVFLQCLLRHSICSNPHNMWMSNCNLHRIVWMVIFAAKASSDSMMHNFVSSDLTGMSKMDCLSNPNQLFRMQTRLWHRQCPSSLLRLCLAGMLWPMEAKWDIPSVLIQSRLMSPIHQSMVAHVLVSMCLVRHPIIEGLYQASSEHRQESKQCIKIVQIERLHIGEIIVYK